MSIKFKKHGFQNPPFRTIVSQIRNYKTFENCHFTSAPNFAPVIALFSLKRLFMGEKIYPFRKATLWDCGGDLKKRWYVSFYVWDMQKNDMIRKREYSVNEYKTKEERYAFAKQRIESINTLLAEGFHIDARKNEEVVEDLRNTTSLEDALRKILEIKKPGLRKASYYCYYSTMENFLSWSSNQMLNKVDIDFFGRYHAQDYVDYLTTENSKTGKTINNKITYLKALFNGLVDRDIIGSSPFSKIKKMKENKSYQNLAFNEKDISELKKTIETEAPKLWVFIQFIYYCYLRPAELRMLKNENIDLAARKIFIPAQISKNGKDDYVDIPSPFYPALINLLSHSDKRSHIFPGTQEGKPIAQNTMTSLHKTFLQKLGFDNRYTLYSWKHTGVVMAYKAGVDIKSIQRQCRHHSIEMTDNYLKSLGLYNNEAFLMKMPSL